MRNLMLGGIAAVMAFAAPVVMAQEHMTSGPAWLLSCYQINDGQFDNYMKYLRTHNIPMSEARKKAGLIVDYKFFMTARGGPNDCDITMAILYSSAGKAFDYSAADDAKDDEISKAHWSQWDEATRKKEQEGRFAMRRFVRSSWAREVTLKPMTK